MKHSMILTPNEALDLFILLSHAKAEIIKEEKAKQLLAEKLQNLIIEIPPESKIEIREL